MSSSILSMMGSFDGSQIFSWDGIPYDTWRNWRNMPVSSANSSFLRRGLSKRNMVTIHSSVAMAACLLASPEVLAKNKPQCVVCNVSDGVFSCEYKHSDGRYSLVVFNGTTKQLFGSRLVLMETSSGEIDWSAPIQNTPYPTLSVKNKGEEHGLPLLLPILAYMADVYPDVASDLKELKACLDTKQNAANVLFRLCDAVYFGTVEDGEVAISLRNGKLEHLNIKGLKSGAFNGAVVAGSQPRVLKGSAVSTGTVSDNNTIGELKRMEKVQAYVQMDIGSLTEKERSLIPDFPEDMIVPSEVKLMVDTIVGTADQKRPVVQLLWRGSSGFGKSTGVEMLACILQKPLLRFTCSSTTERQDFLTQILPDVNNAKTGVNGISFQDVMLDPAGVHEQLTGEWDPEIECETVFQEVLDAAKDPAVPRYVMRESAYIQALKNGWIVEIQEISRIRDVGVLPGLNEYDRPGAMIPMMDGSYARRHPRALVIATDNIGFRSCNDLDPSVIRRFSMILLSEDIPKEKMLARICQNVGIPLTGTISQMYDIWERVVSYAKSQDLMSAGSCSIEELERWVQGVSLLGKQHMRYLLEVCILNKITADPEELKLLKIFAEGIDVESLM